MVSNLEQLYRTWYIYYLHTVEKTNGDLEDWQQAEIARSLTNGKLMHMRQTGVYQMPAGYPFEHTEVGDE